MPKQTNKTVSVDHENYIARLYGGQRSASSGAADNDAGDARVQGAPQSGDLIECKTKGRSDKPLKRTPTLVTVLEKVSDEGWARGLEPAVALRYYLPESPLANSDGWVDLIVRLVADDAARVWLQS